MICFIRLLTLYEKVSTADMKLSLSLIAAAAAAAGSYAKDCDSFSECIIFYNGLNCQGELGNYVPTNEGNCFVFSAFTSVFAVANSDGNVINCWLYSDENCQNVISSLSTANTGIAGTCQTVPLNSNGFPDQFAQSMICVD
jgi:hypothetical protein